MTVDNFAYLRDKLDFSDKSMFYMIQLQQRKKDDESFPANNRTVKTYFIDSLEDYDRLEPEIKRLSDESGARVYIRLNRRSYEAVALQILKELAQILQDKNFQHLKNIVASAAGKVNSEKEKLWIIDVDSESRVESAKIVGEIVKYFNDSGLDALKLIKFQVRTLNGTHLITTKFDSKSFSDKYPEIDIHKDNPTLLYFNPKSN